MPPYGTATVGAVAVTLMARQVDSPIYEFRADIQVDSMAALASPKRSTRTDMIEAFAAAIDDYERKIRGAG